MGKCTYVSIDWKNIFNSDFSLSQKKGGKIALQLIIGEQNKNGYGR